MNAPTPETDAKSPVTIYDGMGREYIAYLVPAAFARSLEQQRNQLKQTLISAINFINSHVDDPDITPKMTTNYAIYQEELEKVKHLLQ